MVTKLLKHINSKGIKTTKRKIAHKRTFVKMDICGMENHPSSFLIRQESKNKAVITVGCSNNNRKSDVCRDEDVAEWFMSLVSDLEGDYNFTITISQYGTAYRRHMWA